MKGEISDSVHDGDLTYTTLPLNPQLFPYFLKIESPILIAGYSGFANMIPIEAILVQTHNHHFGIATDQFRPVGIFLALRGWFVNTVPQTLPRLGVHRLSLIISAQHVCQPLSHCSDRCICFINYPHKAAGNVIIVCDQSGRSTYNGAGSLAS